MQASNKDSITVWCGCFCWCDNLNIAISITCLKNEINFPASLFFMEMEPKGKPNLPQAFFPHPFEPWNLAVFFFSTGMPIGGGARLHGVRTGLRL